MDAHELAIAIPPGLCTEGAGSDAYLPIFPWKGLTTYFIRCCLRVQLLISSHLGTDCNPPWSPKEQVATSPAFSLWLTPTIKPSCQYLPERSLFNISNTPTFKQDPILPSSNSQLSIHSWVPQVYSKHRVIFKQAQDTSIAIYPNLV